MAHKHSAIELGETLEHIVYEIWKYKQSVADYAHIRRAGGDAALKFRVLHQRVLLEFFYGEPMHKNNILASEYIDGWRSTHNPKRITWLQKYQIRCHVMLAHISTPADRPC